MILNGWQFQDWPNGEIAIQRIQDGSVVEWFGPWSAEELAEIVKNSGGCVSMADERGY